MLTREEWDSRSYREDILSSLLRESNREEMIWMRHQAAKLGLPMPTRLPPHSMGPGTSFNGLETLASLASDGAAVGPTASLLSVLNRDTVVPVAPSYFAKAGNRFWVHCGGTISTTATVPTFQLQLVIGPTFANPLTSGQMLGQNATITPAAAANLDWYLDALIVVRATGSSGSLRVTGKLLNNWAASATYVVTPFKNATPPTAVVLTGAGGMMVPLYFDLEVIMGAATAGNTATCLDYELASLN